MASRDLSASSIEPQTSTIPCCVASAESVVADQSSSGAARSSEDDPNRRTAGASPTSSCHLPPLWDITEDKPRLIAGVTFIHSIILLSLLMYKRRLLYSCPNTVAGRLMLSGGGIISVALAFWVYKKHGGLLVRKWSLWKIVAKRSLSEQASELQGRLSSGLHHGKSTLNKGIESAQSYLSGSRQRLEYSFQQQFHDKISKAIDLASVFLKKSAIDKDMPEVIKHLLNDSIDAVLPDLKQQMFHRAQSWLSPARHLGFLSAASPLTTAINRRINFSANARTLASARHRLAQRAKALAVTGTPVLETNYSSEFSHNGSNSKFIRDARRCGRLVIYRYDRLRAQILYSLEPFDKSTWACLKSKRWCALNAIGLVPGFISQIWWLLLFLMKDKSDEYQLANFIVGFETAKFFSVGVWSFVQGALRLFVCVHILRGETSFDSTDTCDTYGARVGWDDFAFFILQLTLVWTCFLLLPSSRRRYRHAAQARPKEEREMESEENRRRTKASPLSRSGEWIKAMYSHLPLLSTNATDDTPAATTGNSKYLRGGYLTSMYKYYVSIVSITVLSSVVIVYCMADEPQWKQLGSLFWIRVAYGLLSFPFVVFKLPLAMQLFVCSTPTAYDQHGRTVLRYGNAEYPRDPSSIPGDTPDISSHSVKRQLFTR
eukprot:gb/GECG01001262.1/.p1 GENE.gb/GECG01001262.1/~~gb/GECG01001262.1/.p1  ORF type:complete len:659 (+),score=62.77 gb/GECG01001262.1/:1-1977(+)